MKKTLQFNIYLICLLLAFSVALVAQKVETVDGVRVVHNEKTGKWGKTPKVSIEFIRNIGELETEDENLAFHIPSDIAKDNQGNIYILDAGNHRIQKFGPDGKYIETIGNRGQGPGEFYLPLSLDIDSGGYLYVSDPQNQRVQILKPDGTDHKTISFHETPAGTIRLLKSGDMVMGKGGIIFSFGPGGGSQSPDKLMKILDSGGNVLNQFGEPVTYKDSFVNRMGNNFRFAVDKDDSVYVTFEYQNRIEKYSPQGEMLWKADRKLDYSTDISKAKAQVKRTGGNVQVQGPQMNRCSMGVAVDARGRIWVVGFKRQLKEDEQVQSRIGVQMNGGQRSVSMAYEGATDNRETDSFQLQIYDPDGILLGTIPLTHFVDDIRIIEDRLFLLDKARGAQYYEYKIIDN
ncbi:MAG: 6-bladed beta-propeller [Candidatus Aenigmarchaeota archaeon]|nr:6-bladed beta-propeller [Candidatus Aenigmarchaeota archaeon]